MLKQSVALRGTVELVMILCRLIPTSDTSHIIRAHLIHCYYKNSDECSFKHLLNLSEKISHGDTVKGSAPCLRHTLQVQLDHQRFDSVYTYSSVSRLFRDNCC